MRVVVVGPCVAGKTTLVTSLQKLGIDAHNVAQEHSGIKQLWRKKGPDVLVMLDVTLPTIRRRRSVPWGEERLIVQRERLRDARKNADLYITTDGLTPGEVLALVLAHIERRATYGPNHGSRPEARS